jgi:putative ABC transport system permease protein
MMSYSLATLWYERQRYLPGVLAVAFSCLLIALQCGLLLGLFSITSLPIDNTTADLWVGHPEVPSVDLGRPIPASWQSYLAVPEVERCEIYMQGFAYWDKPTGGVELCMVIGSRMDKDALGAVGFLTPEMRAQLSEPGAIILDESEFSRLGVTKIGDYAEVTGKRVRIVNTTRGIKSLAGPYIFCNVETARGLLRLSEDQTMFILARCRSKADAAVVAKRLEEYRSSPPTSISTLPGSAANHEGGLPPKMSAFTSEAFSLRSRIHWLTKTKAGIALGCAAALGLLVGAVVTSQTLYAATAASLKEYAVLRAMGIPRWRMAATVLAQSFWVGVAGVALALPTVYALARIGDELGTKVLLPWELLALAVSVTMVMAMLSGLAALRSLRLIEPVALLR